MRLYKIVPSDREKWDSYIVKSGACFLQAWEWGVFQERLGRRVLRFACIDDSGSWINVVSLIAMPLPFGFYWWYMPRLMVHDFESFGFLLSEIEKEAILEKVVFMRVDPMEFDSDDLHNSFLKNGWRFEENASVQPQSSVILDIAHSDDELLADMQAKTRYNINLALKKNIEVHRDKNQKSIVEFCKLLNKTSDRHGLSGHPDKYYQELLKHPETHLFMAHFEGKPIAGLILLIHNDTAVYLHGASDYEYRTLMAPYLLQWEAIRFSREKGVLKYDFWGVRGDGKNTAGWDGITRFKRSFGRSFLNDVKYTGLYLRVLRGFIFYAYFLIRFLLNKKNVLRR